MMRSFACRGLSGPALVALGVVLLTGCVPARVVEYTPFHEREFSERGKPAALQTKPAAELLRSGYLLIGYLDLRRNIRSCYEDNQCIDHSDPMPSTDDIRQEAAQRGGDVLTLLEDRTVVEPHNKSICTSYASTTTIINNKPMVTTYCASYQTIPGKREARLTRALIWRHEPEAARGEANARAIETALKTIESAQQSDKTPAPQTGLPPAAALPPGSTPAAAPSFESLDALSRQILIAIRNNDTALLYSLARDGRLQKWKDDKGRSALMVAIMAGQYGAAATTLAIDRGLDRRDNSGLSALHYAVSRADRDFVQKLIAAGYDLKQDTGIGTPLIYYSLWNPKTEVFEWLLTQGLDPRPAASAGHTALMSAAAAGSVPLTRRLIEMGVAVNQADNNGLTALHFAAVRGKHDVLPLLLEKGAKFDARDNLGNTALHHAAQQGQNGSVRFLLQKGMDINATNQKSVTPVLLAIGSDRWETAEFLLARGAKPVSGPVSAEEIAQILISKNQPKLLQRYFTAFPPLRELARRDPRWLQYAAKVSGRETIRHMVEQGALVDRPGIDGQTPLHTAASAGNAITARALMELKANPALRDRTGQTALKMATLKGHAKVVETLREFGVRD